MHWNIIKKTREWYARFERPISSLSLISGFVFDVITLRRVDQFWENFWIVAHIIIVAVCIVWIHAQERRIGDEEDPSKIHFWLVNVLQFFFGGLLSTYLVFYFRSSALSVSWPFLLLLVLAFMANESFKRHYVRLVFQLSLLYVSIFSFMIFIVPVIVHSLGTGVFLLSGLISLIFMAGFVAILRYFAPQEVERSKKFVISVVLVLFSVINILYFTNVIPPIPLSIKDAGVYHSLTKDQNGDYVVMYEDLGWRKYISLFDNVHTVPGESVYVYSAVFSPTALNIIIVHKLEYFDSQTNRWVARGKANLGLFGGRENGFRTYSEWSGLEAGDWRVNVQTERGQSIGIVRFTIVPVAVEPVLKTTIKK